AAVSWAPDLLDRCGLGVNIDMFHVWWDLFRTGPDGTHGGPSLADWDPLGGIFNSPPAAVSWGPNRLDIFGLGVNNEMLHKWWDETGRAPSRTKWEPSGATFHSPHTTLHSSPTPLDTFAPRLNQATIHTTAQA